jgi:hypothetical protein
LFAYCKAHIEDTHGCKDERFLYRVLYYDCPPIKKMQEYLFIDRKEPIAVGIRDRAKEKKEIG